MPSNPVPYNHSKNHIVTYFNHQKDDSILWDGHLARPGKVTGYFDSTFENVLITTISLVSNTAVHSNAFGKLFDMIVVTFFALGASFYFFTPLFSQIIATSHLQPPCHPLSYSPAPSLLFLRFLRGWFLKH